MHQHFADIDHWLIEHQAFWRIEPFKAVCSMQGALDDLPAELVDWLASLTPEQILNFKSNPHQLSDALTAFVPEIGFWAKAEPSALLTEQTTQINPRLLSGIPGRKVDQITAMSSVCLKQEGAHPWLEWCSGKGYLGRVLASSSQQPVTSLEYQPQLCLDGQQFADQKQLDMHFVQGDAFSQQAKALCQSQQHGVALHACGDLHTTLLSHAAEVGMAALTVAPCCYHLTRDECYQPLSSLGKSSCLQLTKSELRIPLQETVTGGERVYRHRHTEMTYRLGFHQLVSELRGDSTYLPVPSIKKSQLSEGFEAFCSWAAEKKSLTLPTGLDFSRYQLQGEHLFWRMEALSLLPQLFRRPLELWLVLDKALFLIEHGYQVKVGTFCEKATTPRNLIIQARRSV